MPSKQIKARKISTARSSTVQANRLWLAGLGAFSLTQKRLSKAYDGLVTEGRSLQHRARLSAVKFYGEAQTRINAVVQPLSHKATQVAAEANTQIEANVAAVLKRLGVSAKSKAAPRTVRKTTAGKKLKLAK